ncbi:N-acetylglucosamine-6-phosphate deacetylase [Pseudooceanicola sp. CBS1P-1]|uniref:Amidohydrolase family protein n=1 Tax=Pseudooceanicola albus TaxID=2692189 RepID=A0A6L7G3Q5_9RHOB|nr:MULTISPECIES: N-acetylglucosamine-6-phosphate deacetylase [Pseudooceanicola]MBT9385199.1 N-acetylglucosamine-6-phosphate deacetylase [Pseudooceanicola endophyticus]MXN18509.1 amidohydrolase family protein [Pseudooceanicola albus]
MTLLLPDRIWRDGALHADLVAEHDGKTLTAIRPRQPGDQGQQVALLMPACTDLQVNGSGGVMLNSDPTPEGLAAIVAAQRAVGTGWVMPTLITTSLDQMRQAIAATLAAWTRPGGLPGLAGLHIEGPYLNPARKGTHDAGFIRPFDPELPGLLAPLRAAGIPVMVTLAPERVDPADIRALHELGVVVSAGHTAATAEEARAGIAAGITCFTHLFNAMPQMESRAPGVIAAAINSDCHAGIIVDGHHVHWDMVALACRARPRAGRMFAVSDAMATIGGPDHFTLYGERIDVKDGKLVNAAGSLAGAHVTLLECLRNLVLKVGLPEAEAIAMCTDVPNAVIGQPSPALAPGMPLDLVLALDADWRRVPAG